MAALTRKTLWAAPAGAFTALLLVAAHGATAQSATGTVTGRVIWGPCIRALPLGPADSSQAQSAAPAPDTGAVTPDAQQGQPMRPQPVPVPSGLPAGAVLVAVQNTSVSTRTDETGRFTLSGVPAGQYLSIAAGPVADQMAATAERPNVFVNGGQTVDAGTFSLGGSRWAPLGVPCGIVPGVGVAPAPDQSTPGSDEPQSAPPTLAPDRGSTIP